MELGRGTEGSPGEIPQEVGQGHHLPGAQGCAKWEISGGQKLVAVILEGRSAN